MPDTAHDKSTNKAAKRHPPKPISATIADTCKITGLGRTTVYELINQGKLKAIAVGRRRLVLYNSIEALIEGGAP